ncbi:MAG: type II secretion system minor pseudopilin GspK [Thiotrichaceae bacterium]|nr:type II secretion system minor pseudopilin GspK [Thiotrichaceae bacterium]
MNNQAEKQTGIALITALIITALAVSIATTLAYQQYTALRLTSNLNNLQQAYLYATGMEDWVKVLLKRDFNDSNTDDLTEDWATELPALPIPGGTMKGKLIDLQGRLNLNEITRITRPKKRTRQKKLIINVIHKARLQRLLTRLGLVEHDEQSNELIDNLADWIDQDSRVRDRGAESSYYQTLKPAYLPANSEMVSPSELRLVKGFDQLISQEPEDKKSKKPPPKPKSITELILPFISTLPQNTPINVNTASREVILSLGNLSEAQVNNIMTDRDEEPFATISDFLRIFPQAIQKEIDKKSISVTSQYFLLDGKIEIGSIRLYINSVIKRDRNGNSHVIKREFSEI